MSKFTPGPWWWDGPVWDYDHDNEAPWLVSGESKTNVPVITGTLHCSQADARLISAAPDMYEALSAIVDFPADFFDREPNESVTITLQGRHLIEARAALAKAEGK